jgi:predicted O-methyltransferase YrrM
MRTMPASIKPVNAARRAVAHPAWLRETLRGKLRARSDRRKHLSLASHAAEFENVERTITAAYGISSVRYQALCGRLRIPLRLADDMWSAGPELLELTGVVALLRRPQIVVETGVAMGFTSAVILAALDDNGSGLLHSVDLPPLKVDPETFVGRVVPRELRGRWSLTFGPTRTVLPSLLVSVAPIDMFVHDSDHSYDGQLEDYRLVWPALATGGALISDDVCNPAFLEFAAEVGACPYLIGSHGQDAAVGLLVKG